MRKGEPLWNEPAPGSPWAAGVAVGRLIKCRWCIDLLHGAPRDLSFLDRLTSDLTSSLDGQTDLQPHLFIGCVLSTDSGSATSQKGQVNLCVLAPRERLLKANCPRKVTAFLQTCEGWKVEVCLEKFQPPPSLHTHTCDWASSTRTQITASPGWRLNRVALCTTTHVGRRLFTYCAVIKYASGSELAHEPVGR